MQLRTKISFSCNILTAKNQLPFGVTNDYIDNNWNPVEGLLAFGG